MVKFAEGVRVQIKRAPHSVWKGPAPQRAAKDSFRGWWLVIPEVGATLVDQGLAPLVPNVVYVAVVAKGMVVTPVVSP